MNIEENILFNFSRIQKIGKYKFIIYRKLKYVLLDIIYFYEPKFLLVKNNNLIIFKINNISIFIKIGKKIKNKYKKNL